MGISNVVDVQITRATRVVTQAGFGTMLIAGTNGTFPERIRFYTDIDGVADDFATSDAEYKAASAAFSQTPSPTRIAIGRLDANTPAEYVLDFNQDMAGADSVSVTVNGTVCTATTYAALKTAIEAVDGVASATLVGTPTFTITILAEADRTLTVSTLAITSVVGLTGILTNPTPGVTVQDGLTEIQAESDDWYALVLTAKTFAIQFEAALWIEARRKIFVARSSDANILVGSATSDIAYVLKNAGHDRTAVIYHAPVTDDYIDAAILGKMLPEDPGSATFKFKTLAAVSADVLTASQETAALAKNANNYQTVGGVNMFAEGKVASGEFIDIIIGVDWLEARIQERVFSKLVNAKKVPYTDAGAGIIENEVRAQLTEGVRVGLLAADPEFTVTVPKVADQSPTDKGNRYMPGISFDAPLAGAVHKTRITGTVSI